MPLFFSSFGYLIRSRRLCCNRISLNLLIAIIHFVLSFAHRISSNWNRRRTDNFVEKIQIIPYWTSNHHRQKIVDTIVIFTTNDFHFNKMSRTQYIMSRYYYCVDTELSMWMLSKKYIELQQNIWMLHYNNNNNSESEREQKNCWLGLCKAIFTVQQIGETYLIKTIAIFVKYVYKIHICSQKKTKSCQKQHASTTILHFFLLSLKQKKTKHTIAN